MTRLAEMGQFEVPEAVLDRKYRRVGIGVAQDPLAAPPNIVVVVIVSG